MASTKKKAAKKKKTKGKKKKKTPKVNLNKKVANKSRAVAKKSKAKSLDKKIKLKNKRKRVKMSTETVKSGVSSSLDTSHLKVPFPFKKKYGNYIGGKFVEPKSGKYFDNVSPINNEVICQMARSDAKDVDAALDAAHEAFKEWGKTDITTRSNIMNKIADVLEKNLNLLATAECLDNGKPISCLLYTSPSPRDGLLSRMPSSA